MRLLIDTHVFLWAVNEPEALSVQARSAIEDIANEVYVSAAVSWEIAIKYRKGALSLPLDPSVFVPSRIRSLSLRELAITHQHALATAALPPIHTDPFDRVMIAQAQCEGLTFTTRDPYALEYAVLLLKA